MSKVLITGAAGYIGGRLVAHYAGAGWDVHAVVRERTPWLDVEQTACDLSLEGSARSLADACEGADVVVHLAGDNEVRAAEAPAAVLARTVVATERLAEACAAAGVRRVVYMSTVHVYGTRIEPEAILEERMRVEPRSAYAISRLASEHVAASLAAGHFELAILRLTNSVGAPAHPAVDRWSLVANDLCRQGALDGELRLRSSGMQWRDFVGLGDVCVGIERAGQPATNPGTYNLGSGKPRTVRQLAAMIQDAFEQQTGTRPPLHAMEAEADPPGPYEVSVARAAGAGLLAHEHAIETAIAEMVAFCLHNRDELAARRDGGAPASRPAGGAGAPGKLAA